VTLERAEKFIGKEVMFQNHTSKLIRVTRLYDDNKGGMIIGETDNGMIMNIDLLKTLDVNDKWKYIT